MKTQRNEVQFVGFLARFGQELDGKGGTYEDLFVQNFVGVVSWFLTSGCRESTFT